MVETGNFHLRSTRDSNLKIVHPTLAVPVTRGPLGNSIHPGTLYMRKGGGGFPCQF